MFSFSKISLILAATWWLQSCGGSSSNDSAPTRPDQKQPSGTSLEASNISIKDANGNDVLWNAKALVNGNEAFKLEYAKFQEVAQKLDSVKTSKQDTLRVELSGYDYAKQNVLATNLLQVAGNAQSTKEIWDKECSAVTPDVALSDSAASKTKFNLKVCDFTGVTLKPIVNVAPQAQRLEKKTVIYHCQVTPKGSSFLYTTGNSTCEYGYATEAGEAAPEMHVLKKYAPGSATYAANPLLLTDLTLQKGNDSLIALKTSWSKMPFGSGEGCHTQKIDVKYSSPQGLQSMRLTYKLQKNDAGDSVLIPQNAGTWPKIDDVLDYYSNARNEKIDIYRICEWIPEVQDLLSGEVIKL